MFPGNRGHLWALLSLVFCGASPALAQYTYTDLYTLQASGYNTVAFESIAQNGQEVGFGANGAGPRHALIWSGPGNPLDVTPSGYSSSQIASISINGTQQVGRGVTPDTDPFNHALLWAGTAASVVDLNPAGFTTSFASGTNGTQQVGLASGPSTNNGFHAFLWNGTAASAVDLNPTGFTSSSADGTNGTQQVGSGSSTSTAGHNHALLWTGTAASAVDLHPTGFGLDNSYALATSGTQQVGYGDNLDRRDALLWSGTATSAIDLNPGFDFSGAVATNGIQQVGYGYSGPSNISHALVWSGSANSVVDLGAFLPSDFNSSQAQSIDANGNVFGIAIDTSGNYHAIEWTSIPEPSALALVAFGGLVSMRRR